jgi:imidazolonepropionase
MQLFKNICKLYTPLGFGAAHGPHAMRNVVMLERAEILVDDAGEIVSVGSDLNYDRNITRVFDCRGLVALPGFVDSHTHAVFAGNRSNEFAMRAEGKSYQEVAEAGGGIKASMESVRESSQAEIAVHSKPYLGRALALGTTTIEIKSGYGLDAENELKLLKAAQDLRSQTEIEIHTTFLGAHAFPPGVDHDSYVDDVINKQLPVIANAGAAEFIDVFCDEGYFTNEQTRAIINAGKKAGLRPRIHADELADTHGAALAVELGCLSADHLLKISDTGIRALAASNTVATLLPTTALSIRAPFAPARKLIDAGAIVAIATDCNPGSSMSENMQFAMTLAVIGMQMTVEEALTSATLNGAAALGLEKTHGTIEPGKFMDVVLYDIPELAYLPYHIAVSDVVAVIKRGQIVYGRESLNR